MNDTEQLWLNCLASIRQQVPDQQFVTWFEPFRFLAFQNGELTLGVPNRFLPDYVEGHFLEIFRKALVAQFGTRFTLRYKVTEEEAKPAPQPLLNPAPATPAAEHRPRTPQDMGAPLPLDPQLNPRYTFETFVEGASNKLPRSVGLSIAERPGQSSFNPLFLYGPSGVGKTHLANAIGVRIRELYPDKRVLFVSAHLFKTQYTDSHLHNTSNDFINFYQSIDVLIIDDIQEITTPKTQLAFFHIFNHLQQNNRQIVITCDRPPVLFEGIEERMLTRFKWGMVAELEKPDTKLRRDILLSKIRRDGLEFPADVVQYIAQHVNSSVRELEGIINSIMAYSVVDNCEIDIQLTQRVVARAVNLEQKALTDDHIIQAVCQRYGVKPKDLSSKCRKQQIVQARQMAMYLCHKYTEITYSRLGRRFGGRDHSTVLYACNQVVRRMSVDKAFRHEVEEMEAALNKG
ncbi:MAG: chromosomal replication initiator protein DnaA [Alloprevotella sp.]|nr:chromosomal replication initiator protein DnaA [Bacteroidales bacterium]MDD6583667.1 chromosomal replication initiator protein DnaA [Bacteroidales bacterium]